MKKIIKLSETDLKNIVQRVINENERVYGDENIKKLYDKIKDDEAVYLDDTSGDLSGTVVSKIEYVKRMLRTSIQNKDWSKVQNAILYIDTMIK